MLNIPITAATITPTAASVYKLFAGDNAASPGAEMISRLMFLITAYCAIAQARASSSCSPSIYVPLASHTHSFASRTPSFCPSKITFDGGTVL